MRAAKSILLAGYSGFIGRRLLSRLLHEDHSVICVGRRPPEVALSPRCRFYRCDLADGAGLQELPWKEIDTVAHLASAGVSASHRFWPECLAVNIVGLQHLLTAVGRFANVQRLIVTGTFYEKLLETNPVLWENPYVATKWTATQNLRLWSRHYDVATSVLHLFQIYGSDDGQSSVLSYIKNSLKAGKVVKLGSGRSRRDWLHIDDAIDALSHALELPSANGFNSYDIGSGELHSIREAAEIIADLTGTSRDLLDFDWKRDRHDSGIELAAARPLPGWVPRLRFSAGLEAFAKT